MSEPSALPFDYVDSPQPPFLPDTILGFVIEAISVSLLPVIKARTPCEDCRMEAQPLMGHVCVPSYSKEDVESWVDRCHRLIPETLILDNLSLELCNVCLFTGREMVEFLAEKTPLALLPRTDPEAKEKLVERLYYLLDCSM